MGALAVSQLLENAQDKGVEIALETAAVENQVSTLFLHILCSFYKVSLKHRYTDSLGRRYHSQYSWKIR